VRDDCKVCFFSLSFQERVEGEVVLSSGNRHLKPPHLPSGHPLPVGEEKYENLRSQWNVVSSSTRERKIIRTHRACRFTTCIQKKKDVQKIMFLSKAHNLLQFSHLPFQERHEQKICPLIEYYRVEP